MSQRLRVYVLRTHPTNNFRDKRLMWKVCHAIGKISGFCALYIPCTGFNDNAIHCCQYFVSKMNETPSHMSTSPDTKRARTTTKKIIIIILYLVILVCIVCNQPMSYDVRILFNVHVYYSHCCHCFARQVYGFLVLNFIVKANSDYYFGVFLSMV